MPKVYRLSVVSASFLSLLSFIFGSVLIFLLAHGSGYMIIGFASVGGAMLVLIWALILNVSRSPDVRFLLEQLYGRGHGRYLDPDKPTR